MRLRNRTLSLIAFTLAGLVMMLYATSRVLILGAVARLEDREVRAHVDRALNALQDRLVALDAIAADWGTWDDTYEFAGSENAGYIDSNLTLSTFSNLDIHMMLFVDPAGRVIFGRRFDLSSGEVIPIPIQLREYFNPRDRVRLGAGSRDALTGLAVLPDGPVLLAARPILRSDGAGPSRGTLVIGQYLDSAAVSRLAETTHLTITVHRPDEQEIPNELRSVPASASDQELIRIRPLGTEVVAGYGLVRDIGGQPAIVLKVEVPRSIYKQGQASVVYFLTWLVAASLAFGAVILAFLERTVLSRLALLSASVHAIGASGDLARRVPVRGRDELSSLARQINRMLEALGRYQDELRSSEDRYRHLSVTDSLTGLHNRMYFEHEIRRLEAEKCAPAAVVLCDVDGLKVVNDTLGHEAGDELLLTAARAFGEVSPDEGSVARIGGDEFAMLLPGSDEAAARDVASRLQAVINAHNAANPERPLSASIGLAARDDTTASMTEVFKQADDNMYREKLHRSRSARSAIVQTLMKAMETRDFITEGHLDRLERLVARVAAAVGLPERDVGELRLLARFHDIGKVGVPDRIFLKPGTLTPEEIDEMRLHCEIGLRIAQSVPELAPIGDWILKHHEWWNGQGYPLGLQGEDIPLECRIISIVDAYDAMTSDRPYRTAMTHEEAVAELRRCAGTQFDPQLVEEVVRILESSGGSADPDERLAQTS